MEGMERLHAGVVKGVHKAKKDACLKNMLACATDAGFNLYKFLDELMHMKDNILAGLTNAGSER